MDIDVLVSFDIINGYKTNKAANKARNNTSADKQLIFVDAMCDIKDLSKIP
jgi:hypothetical protein